MTFVPKDSDHEVNLPRQSQALEFLYLLGGLLGIILAVYIALGFAVNLIVPHIPESAEQYLAGLYKPKDTAGKRDAAEKKLQEMADSLSYLHSGRRYNVHVIKSPDINALAAPGGSIYVFSGLIGEVKSENEMAFVLAHEIGHFENRDQLRGLGRGLVLFVISLAFTGSESGLTKVAGEAIKNAQMKLSRDRERAADQFALDLIAKKYGNAAGAVSMLSRFGPLDDRYPRWLYYFITHPYYKDRISLVEKRIGKMGYKAGAQLPVPAELKSHKIPKERRTLKGF